MPVNSFSSRSWWVLSPLNSGFEPVRQAVPTVVATSAGPRGSPGAKMAGLTPRAIRAAAMPAWPAGVRKTPQPVLEPPT